MFSGRYAMVWQMLLGIAIGLVVAESYPFIAKFFPPRPPIELHIRIELPPAPMPAID
jgi:hypothetical protein